MSMSHYDYLEDVLNQMSVPQALAHMACQLIDGPNADPRWGHALKQFLRDSGYRDRLDRVGRDYGQPEPPLPSAGGTGSEP